MPSKKKKYNARFPAGRIKKIMQSDEEIGKVAQAVPVIISRTLELFVESLLTKTLKITNSRNAKTLSTSHMKQCIMAEQRFDFLRELVKNISDISVAEEAAANCLDDDAQSSNEEQYPDSDTPYDLSMPSTSTRATRTNNNFLTNGGDNDTNARRTTTSQNGNGGIAKPAQTMPNGPQYDEQRARLLKRIQRLATGSGTVITHTTAALAQVNAECLPAKLARSDSTPANMTTDQHQNWTPAMQSRQAFSIQSLSVPANNTNNSRNKSASTPQKQPKSVVHPQQHTQQLHKPQTAIPAPIVSFDFCNKPIVKIDYSNLPVSTRVPPVGASAPLSAPANMHTSTAATAFNFSAEPIISIDLSNIVANASSSSTACINGPAVATISIGALAPSAPAAAAGTPSPPQHSSNSKATLAASFNDAAATKSVIPAASGYTNSFFELDEDYDNI